MSSSLIQQSAPVTVLVTLEIGGRQQPVVGDLCGQDGLMPALLDHLQRVACEGARGAWAAKGFQAEKMAEADTGRSGWRAFIQNDTAHLIHVLEETGIARFEDG